MSTTLPESAVNNAIVDHRGFQALARVGAQLGIPVDRTDMIASSRSDVVDDDPLANWLASAHHAGIVIAETPFVSTRETIGFVRNGFPVVLVGDDGRFLVLSNYASQRVEALEVGESTVPLSLSHRQVRRKIRSFTSPRIFVCKPELECATVSAAHHEHGEGHPSPQRRFIGLLRLERRDIATVILFAFVSGILALATPLAIESLVNVVSWGTYLQPLVALGVMLLACLGLAGVLKVLQTVVVEIIQRRQFVRIVGDLAHRFPRVELQSLSGQFPRELANRLFDIMTIQKATAVLLLDGVAIVLTTALGMLLLAFYHPFLLGFDIVLLISMISVTWLLGRGGIRTAVDESITKYKVVHWLQDVIAMPSVFKTGGGESLAVNRANLLTGKYIEARRKQFRVVIRQAAFAIMLQVIASTAVLALGGWLVIDGQLTLGQLVASELVVTLVVGAFAKAGKSLEKFYDLMAGIDKVGHLLDLPSEARYEISGLPAGPAQLQWSELKFQSAAWESHVAAGNVDAGRRVAIVGDDIHGRSMLTRALAGLETPSAGTLQVAGVDAAEACISGAGRTVGYAGEEMLFHGTLRENIDLGRPGIAQHHIRGVIEAVGLSDVIGRLPSGLQTRVQTGGYPLNPVQVRQLVLARAIVTRPQLLLVDGLLDDLNLVDRERIWQSLSAADAPWTLLINTNREDVAQMCDLQISVRTQS